ncbi:MAG: GDSL-type esterase/lipase family protein [Lachnospiraceae bacterium]
MKHTYQKLIFITAVAGALALFSACTEATQTWNPSFVSLTPAPTKAAEPTAEPQTTEVPTEMPLPTEAVPTEPAAKPTAEPTIEPTIKPTEAPSDVPELTKDDFNAADFFKDTVFAGDSVLSLFYWRVPYYDKETFGGSDFLVAVSYSAREALKENSDLHPIYKGEQQPIWESMKLMNPKRVMLFFGLNDIGVNGVDGFIENYKKLIANIQAAVPETKIYIISITPMRADCEGPGLTNAKITEANGKIQEYCLENGMGYIDVATMLMDETGALNTEYSDGTNVHLTKEAYLMWKDVLVDYAKEQLLKEYEAAGGPAE